MNRVILFDGVCNLCDGFVNFVIDRDPAGRFSFAALQTDAARALLRQHGLTPPDPPESVYLLENGQLYERSEAVLRVLGQLDSGWHRAAALRVVPRPLRDLAYNVVARYRYQLLGKHAACRLPTPELARRFL